MNRPIEPGCRCVVVNDDYPPIANGIIVTIDKFFIDGFGTERWIVNEDVTMYGWPSNSIPPFKLKRIDDDGKEELSTWDEIAKLGFIPNRDKAEA